MTRSIPTNGRTGHVLTTQEQLDRLPAGTVVVPLWMSDRIATGQTACVKFGGDPGTWHTLHMDSPVFPLGGPNDHRHGVRVIYDPRDEL